MAANVKFIIGRAGSGKTRAVFEGVAENERKGKKSLLIVPDRATFETERELSVFLGGGIMFASVLSFTRLARRLLAEAGVRTRFLSAQGRQMLVRRVLDESAKELSVFSGVGAKRGFAAECDEIILKCKRCSITPEQLSSAEGLPDQLRSKLADFALIYDRTVKRMENEYIDGEDLVNRLIDLLPASSVRGADVFIDAPDMMNAQSFRIIGSLFSCAASVTLTFRIDPDPSADEALFGPDRLSFERLNRIAAGCGCSVRTLELRGNRRQSGALAFLERNLFAYPFEKTDMEAGNIELHTSIDKTCEVREAAERIIKAVRESRESGGEKLRFRDIAVVVGDLPAYACAIRRCFGEYGIPLFMDAGRSVSAHPVSELIIGALRTVSGGFRAEDYIRVLKSGLSGIDDDAVEKLENHILRFGLNGKRLSGPEPSVVLNKDMKEIKGFAELEASRMAVSEKLNLFHDKLMASRSATERAAAVYDYLLSVGAPSAIQKSCEELAKSPETKRYADESAQAFDTVIALLDQTHIILGDEPVGLDRFLSVIEEGLAAYEINVIPTLLDQVLVGDAGGVHLGKTRMLLVLGANDGMIPRRRDDNSVINDRELMLMQAAGLNTWDSSESMNRAEDLRLYSLLTKPTETLFVSHCVKRGEQTAAPSFIVPRIQAALGRCLRTESGEGPASAGAAAFSDLAAGLRTFIDTGDEAASLAPLYAHFAQDGTDPDALKTLESLYFAGRAKRSIGPAAASSLYGQSASGSPTRLETFNRCPFCYLMQFGLALKEREKREERAVDHGTLIHEALDRLLKPLIEQQPDFSQITKKDLEAQLDEFLPALFTSHNYGFLLESAQNRAEMERLRGEILALAFAIVYQLASGSFRPYKSEYGFGKKDDPLKALEITGSNGFTFRITGVVDRVDTLTSESGAYFRIIDYKTGDVKFQYSELASGLKLQLPLYAAAVQAGFPEEQKTRPSGFYYMHVVDLNTVTGDAETDDYELIKKLKLSGPSFSDEAVLSANGEFKRGYSLVIKGLQFSSKTSSYSSKSGLLIDGEKMADTIEFAKQKAGETLDAIMSGRADVSPSKLGSFAACKYCASRSICGFDTTSGSRYRLIRPVTPELFYEEREKEKKAKEKAKKKEEQ